MKKSNDTKQVLADHKRVGKRFVPPFLQLANIQEVQWIDHILPEIIWMGLLNSYFDLKEGAKLSLSLSKAANDIYAARNARLFAAISSYSLLDNEQCRRVVEILDKSNQLKDLQKALYPMVVFYPECPLNFLFQPKLFTSKSKDSGLMRFKKMLASSLDRMGKHATFMQANIIYIAFCTNVFKAHTGSTISQFPKIVDYPKTEESKRIASSIRASINFFFGASKNEIDMIPNTFWPAYFWNRGLVIESCQLD